MSPMMMLLCVCVLGEEEANDGQVSGTIKPRLSTSHTLYTTCLLLLYQCALCPHLMHEADQAR